MRSTGIIAAISCLLLLTGCDAKSSVQTKEASLTMRMAENCTAYVIADNITKYTFHGPGTQSVLHGKYVVLITCPPQQSFKYPIVIDSSSAKFTLGSGQDINDLGTVITHSPSVTADTPLP